MASATAVLEVEGLRTELSAGRGVIKAVDGMSFSLRRGETLAIVGESGCGKSMTALSLMRLVPEPPGKIVGGSVKLDGKELLASIPRLALIAGESSDGSRRLKEIPGMVPSLADLPAGCTFAPRCAFADERCRREFPPYEQKRPGHWAACWHSERLHVS